MKPTTPNRTSSLIPSGKSTAVLVLILLAATIFTWRVLHDQFFTETDLSVWQRDWMELEICNKKVQSFCTSISKYPFAYLLNSGAANLLAGRTHIDQWWGGLRNASTTLNSAACAIALLAATCTATSREKVSILIYCLALLLTPRGPVRNFLFTIRLIRSQDHQISKQQCNRNIQSRNTIVPWLSLQRYLFDYLDPNRACDLGNYTQTKREDRRHKDKQSNLFIPGDV